MLGEGALPTRRFQSVVFSLSWMCATYVCGKLWSMRYVHVSVFVAMSPTLPKLLVTYASFCFQWMSGVMFRGCVGSMFIWWGMFVVIFMDIHVSVVSIAECGIVQGRGRPGS